MRRFLVPALQVGPGQTGVGVYTLELIRALSQATLDDEEFVVAAPHPREFDFLQGIEGFSVEPIQLLRDDSWGRMMATHTTVPRVAERLGVDLVMGVNFIAPLWGRFATSVLVHDLTFHHYPATMPRMKRLYYQFVVRRSIRRSKVVFVTTKTMARELAEYEPGAVRKIRIAPGGVPSAYLVNGEEERRGRSRRQGRPRSSFLFVGTLEPRKNLERLLTAHAALCRFDPDFPALRVVGGRGWEDAGIRRTILAHPDPSRLQILGYCHPSELKEEYDGALALLFPSLYEGFGLPALEAMARGCPVLTSKGIATAEVTEDAALLVDPLDGGELERAMRRLADDSSLRDRLAAAGLNRARSFTWERGAEKTLRALREPDLLPARGDQVGR